MKKIVLARRLVDVEKNKFESLGSWYVSTDDNISRGDFIAVETERKNLAIAYVEKVTYEKEETVNLKVISRITSSGKYFVPPE